MCCHVVRKVKKPVKPQTVIHATTAGNKEEVSVPVSILAAVPRPTGDPTLLVAHGSAVKPKFETVVSLWWRGTGREEERKRVGSWEEVGIEGEGWGGGRWIRWDEEREK